MIAPYLAGQVPPLLPDLSSPVTLAPNTARTELAGGRRPSDICHPEPVRHGTTRPGPWRATLVAMSNGNVPAGGVVLSRLSKSYGEVRAVASIDLAIAAGETVALLGPNGAGKTTTIDMMLGCLLYTSPSPRD